MLLGRGGIRSHSLLNSADNIPLATLKKVILAENPNRFWGIDAYIHISLSFGSGSPYPGRGGEFEESKLENHGVLDGGDRVRDHFDEDPPEKYIHIIIKPPEFYHSILSNSTVVVTLRFFLPTHIC